MDLQALIDQAVGLWTEAREIWLSGGWAMIAISVIALVMFSVGMGLHFKLRAKGFQRVPESTWRRWIDRRLEREGVIGDLMDEVADTESIEGPYSSTVGECIAVSIGSTCGESARACDRARVTVRACACGAYAHANTCTSCVCACVRVCLLGRWAR